MKPLSLQISHSPSSESGLEATSIRQPTESKVREKERGGKPTRGKGDIRILPSRLQKERGRKMQKFVAKIYDENRNRGIFYYEFCHQYKFLVKVVTDRVFVVNFGMNFQIHGKIFHEYLFHCKFCDEFQFRGKFYDEFQFCDKLCDEYYIHGKFYDKFLYSSLIYYEFCHNNFLSGRFSDESLFINNFAMKFFFCC